jgi:glycosyltransferase involved in cell wall biosynthesis
MCHNVESKWFEQRISASRRGLASVPLGTKIKTPLFRTWQTNGTIKLADHVICLSSEDERYLQRRLGKASHQVTRIVNGVDEEDFGGTARNGRRGVLFVGGWHDVKGAHLLPEIFRHVRARFPQVTLTIAGAGAPPSAVVGEFAPDDRTFVTVVPESLDSTELRALYRQHEVFLMPSLSEGSPLSLLEAMAAGCPVVAAEVGGIPDIVRDGADGLLFAAMNAAAAAAAVGRILNDSMLSRSLRESALERVRGFTWSETARGVERAATVAAGKTFCHA